MGVENLVMQKSPITDEIYVGYIKKTKFGIPTWKDKKNVTNDFMRCVIERWNGYEETISGGGKTYVISVREVEDGPKGIESTESPGPKNNP